MVKRIPGRNRIIYDRSNNIGLDSNGVAAGGAFAIALSHAASSFILGAVFAKLCPDAHQHFFRELRKRLLGSVYFVLQGVGIGEGLVVGVELVA